LFSLYKMVGGGNRKAMDNNNSPIVRVAFLSVGIIALLGGILYIFLNFSGIRINNFSVNLSEGPLYNQIILITAIISVTGGITGITGVVNRIFPRNPKNKAKTNPWKYLPYFLISLSVVLLVRLLVPIQTIAITAPKPNSCDVHYSTYSSLHEVNLSPSSNECIGISDGDTFFDMNAALENNVDYNSLKHRVLALLKASKIVEAQALWESANVSNDAEMLVYLENARVLASHQPYYNFVVATILTGNAPQIGRDGLQGAYVAQKEYNQFLKMPGGIQIRLLIANSGSGKNSAERAVNANIVSSQIARLAPTLTIKGVMGWPYSGQVITSNPILSAAHIPSVSSSASSDELSAKPYFWRIAPPNATQAQVAGPYAVNVLHTLHAAVFYDETDSYSATLGTNFLKTFETASQQKAIVEKYTIGAKNLDATMQALLQDVLIRQPNLDLIYFSGYPEDASALFEQLPSASIYPHLRIMGGDALGVKESYRFKIIPPKTYGRFYYTVFAHPDEDKSQPITSPFFCEYTSDFDPHVQCPSANSGLREHFNQPNAEGMLGYDATLVLIVASAAATQKNGVNFSPEDLQASIGNIRGDQSIQGVTGQISLEGGSDPANKAIVMLSADSAGTVSIAPNGVQGCFLKGTCTNKSAITTR